MRSHNEDAARAEGGVFVVADGMGGHAAGEVASRIAVDAVAELAGRPDLSVDDLVAQVGEANRRILDSVAEHPARSGMGTTVTGLAVVRGEGGREWAVFNVGDSRTYRFADGRLAQVTVDHSHVQELVDSGIITPEQARWHPGRNVVTRVLGRPALRSVDVWLLPPQPGQVFVLCSDGLSNELTDAEIEGILTEAGGEVLVDAQAVADELVRRAVEAGGRDNVTVVVVATGGAPADAVAPDSEAPREAPTGHA
ncbi:PP2C family protein-serine/threonine phosphatase [Intrasporangium oryzae]|uniref:PP2C family protein-serine/threonine phosphatase n=1 Tax=Intrasporangium oryzae TaxID=412687 RepID=UPI00068418AB|nr:protein phosphatase 2C domain-containing protein [Intrasporangium oryzae]